MSQERPLLLLLLLLCLLLLLLLCLLVWLRCRLVRVGGHGVENQGKRGATVQRRTAIDRSPIELQLLHGVVAAATNDT